MSSQNTSATSKIEAAELNDRYTSAVAEIRRSQKIESGQAAALMFAALAYGDALESKPLFATASHLAKLFCIAALFVIPNLLVIHVLL